MRNSVPRVVRAWAVAALIAASAASASPGIVRPAPQFTLATSSGEKISLSRFKGRVVMLNFWASWCGPCRQEMPLLDRMYARYAPAGFTLLGIGEDTDETAARKLLARTPVGFTVLLDPENRVAVDYHVEELPTTVIIDRKGIVRYVHRGYLPGDENGYRNRVRKLLGE